MKLILRRWWRSSIRRNKTFRTSSPPILFHSNHQLQYNPWKLRRQSPFLRLLFNLNHPHLRPKKNWFKNVGRRWMRWSKKDYQRSKTWKSRLNRTRSWPMDPLTVSLQISKSSRKWSKLSRRSSLRIMTSSQIWVRNYSDIDWGWKSKEDASSFLPTLWCLPMPVELWTIQPIFKTWSKIKTGSMLMVSEWLSKRKTSIFIADEKHHYEIESMKDRLLHDVALKEIIIKWPILNTRMKS